MGRINTWHSRRINFNLCDFWIRDERDSSGSPEKWILNKFPSGQFYARPISPNVNQENVINNSWMLDRNFVTLETDDEVHDLTRGCIVKYNNQLYIVENVQAHIHLKESQFGAEEDYKYVISMRR